MAGGSPYRLDSFFISLSFPSLVYRYLVQLTMHNSGWYCLCTLAVARQAFAAPHYPQYAGNNSVPASLMPRQDDSFDVGDLSFITKLAAIGDSFSAGIGAGDRLGNVFQALDPQSGMLPLYH